MDMDDDDAVAEALRNFGRAAQVDAAHTCFLGSLAALRAVVIRSTRLHCMLCGWQDEPRPRTPPAERSTTPPSELWRSGMRRAACRRSVLKEDASAAVTVASLSDLYGLERHAAVPASMRGEQLQRIVLHYIMYLSEWWRSEMPEPAFVRLGRVGELPAVEDITEAAAEEGEPVQSRRHDGDTPSVLLTAHEAKAKARTRPEQVARYELYREAIEYVDALLTQYYDEKKVRTKS